jgi:hypothetical protein
MPSLSLSLSLSPHLVQLALQRRPHRPPLSIQGRRQGGVAPPLPPPARPRRRRRQRPARPPQRHRQQVGVRGRRQVEALRQFGGQAGRAAPGRARHDDGEAGARRQKAGHAAVRGPHPRPQARRLQHAKQGGLHLAGRDVEPVGVDQRFLEGGRRAARGFGGHGGRGQHAGHQVAGEDVVVVAGQPDADLVKGEGGGETGLSRGTLMPAPSARSQHTHTHTHTHTP